MYRDFIYMDEDRIQSIIAQLQQGTLTQVITGNTKELTGSANITAGLLSKIIPFGIEGSGTYNTSNQVSKVLHDFAFNIALESLEEASLLFKPEGWTEGKEPPEASFILTTGTVSLIDYQNFSNLAENERALDILFGTSLSSPPTSGKGDRGRVSTKKPSASVLKQMKMFADIFMGDSLEIRFETDTSSFIGPINRKFLRENSRSLIFKYGSGPQQDWTLLAQICKIPTPFGKFASLGTKFSEIQGQFSDSQGQLSTAGEGFSKLAEAINVLQEAIASVSYPHISITPIALFRESSPL